jgi:putative photosynthetic complex assembly protein 2
MADYGIAACYALFLWWFSTGLIFCLNRLPRSTHRWTMLGASAIAVAAVFGLAASAGEATAAAAYIAFGCAIAVWGWQELSYYMDLVSGPRKRACHADCSGWRHFGHAIQTSLYHELAVIAGAAVVAGVTWNAPNQVGLWTYVILWLMRWSAKLNVFLGVYNLNIALLPEHMRFLEGFMARRRMNPLFPVSATVGTVVTVVLAQRALTADGSFEAAGFAVLAVLAALGTLEHWFLMLPLQSEALWSWSLRPRAEQPALAADIASGLCATPNPVRGETAPTSWRRP